MGALGSGSPKAPRTSFDGPTSGMTHPVVRNQEQTNMECEYLRPLKYIQSSAKKSNADSPRTWGSDPPGGAIRPTCPAGRSPRTATSADRSGVGSRKRDLCSRRPPNPAFAAPIHTRVLAHHQAVESSVGRSTASAPCPQRVSRGAGARTPIAAGAFHCVGTQRLRAARR
jgi:hypothetical protein